MDKKFMQLETPKPFILLDDLDELDRNHHLAALQDINLKNRRGH